MKLLDTNICIAWLSDADRGVRRQLTALEPGDAVLCCVVKAELLYGARKSAKPAANLSKLETLFSLFDSLPFDDAASEEYGSLRAQLEAAGTPLGANDLLIAAIALANDATVVTRNEDEFRRVPGLRVEVW